MAANAPSIDVSPEGRRILVAVVTGQLGDQIQEWRRRNDPVEAERIPPHTTLCYWAPELEPGTLESQVRHAFGRGVTVRLGEVRQFASEQETFYLEVLNSDRLDAARRLLYDGRFVKLPELREWPWHVSCVRDARGREIEALRGAASALALNADWRIDTIAYLQLRGKRYEPLATWRLAE